MVPHQQLSLHSRLVTLQVMYSQKTGAVLLLLFLALLLLAVQQVLPKLAK